MQATALDRAFYDTGCASVLPTFQPPWTQRTTGNGVEIDPYATGTTRYSPR